MKTRAIRQPPIQSENIVHGCAAGMSGMLTIPPGASAIVLVAYASRTDRPGRECRILAETLNECGLATLLFDLFEPGEGGLDFETRQRHLDVELLGDRLVGAIDWVGDNRSTRGLRLGLFGSGSGAAAAVLVAAARRPALVRAVVSRGGRPDHAGDALAAVKAPAVLSFRGWERAVIELNGDPAKPWLEIPPRSDRRSILIPTDVRHLARGGSGPARPLAAVACAPTTIPCTDSSEDHDPIKAEARLACRWFREKLTVSGNRPRLKRAMATMAWHEEDPYRR